MIAQLAQLQRLLLRQTGDTSASKQDVHFDRKLLDFDYGSEEEDDHTSPKTAPAVPSGLESVGR